MCFAVLAVADNTNEHDVKTTVLFKTVGSYKGGIDFHSQLYEKMSNMEFDPFSKELKKLIFSGAAEVYALLVDPDIYHTCRELDDKKAYDANGLLQRKTLAKFDVSEYVKLIIEERWPLVQEPKGKKK